MPEAVSDCTTTFATMMDEAEGVEIVKPFPRPADYAPVSDCHEASVGYFPVLARDLERAGLLSLRHEWVVAGAPWYRPSGVRR